MRPEIDFKTDPENWKILTPPLHVMWKQMEDLVKAGKIRSIGVSNCTIPMLLDLLSYAEVKPAVNQVESTTPGQSHIAVPPCLTLFKCLPVKPLWYREYCTALDSVE